MVPIWCYKFQNGTDSYNTIWSKLSEHLECQPLGSTNKNPVSIRELVKESKAQGFQLLSPYSVPSTVLRTWPESFQWLLSISCCYYHLHFVDCRTKMFPHGNIEQFPMRKFWSAPLITLNLEEEFEVRMREYPSSKWFQGRVGYNHLGK